MTLIAVHFPKAGGSSVLNALQLALGARLHLDYQEDPALSDSPRNVDPIGYFERQPELPEDVRCVYGHFHPGKYRHLRNAKRFTLLRDPIDTMFSIYFSFQVQPITGLLIRYTRENKLSLLQMARLPLLTRLMSDTYFGGVDMASFDFIGRHDKRTESLQALAGLLETEIDPSVRINVTVPDERRDEMQRDPALRAQLADILRDDVRFYEQHAFRDV